MIKILAGAAIFAALLPPVHSIWPVPQQISTGSDVLFIEKSLKVTYNGEELPWTSGKCKDKSVGKQFILQRRDVNNSAPSIDSEEIVRRAIRRTYDAIFSHGLEPWMLKEPEAPGRDGKRTVSSLTITQTGKDQAASKVGALFFKDEAQRTFYTTKALVSIYDYPKFAHRGMLLDLARSWYPIPDVKRTIDGLAMSKMNVIHLHMTDTQSWPLEIPALPELAQKGAFAPGLTYSPEEIQDLQEYAAERGVQAILEIDMPGHVGVAEAYPDLSVAYNAVPYNKYCAEPPCGSLLLNNTEVEGFIKTLFDDLLPRLANYTIYFHTGGDEYKAENSLLDPALKTKDKSILQPMLQRFLDYSNEQVRKHGFTRIIWDDLIDGWNATIGNDTIIQSWHGKDGLKKLAHAGYKIIDSNSDYLPCGRGGYVDYRDENLAARYPFTDWCAPTKNWRVIYMHDSTEGMSKEAAKNVLGGEVAVWTETIDPTILDSIAWPRAAAAGEGWWSGRKDENGQKRSVWRARPRLAEMRERMLARGIRGSPVSTLFCGQHDLEDCTI
ncbi:Glucosamine-6-phosphate isomerase (Glucosamine-6-phosphate deaminase) (GNPDA) (GlcN6P deaminase) [Lecanicillium sp. MT-2017a]|nr:Glucosamine-6-phosphate isomerase (Glucosamine-6-phosphate deaminase) (GNPDA) (GlcN6P deaminase) [Lecanicillium sp. MT-2017a]